MVPYGNNFDDHDTDPQDSMNSRARSLMRRIGTGIGVFLLGLFIITAAWVLIYRFVGPANTYLTDRDRDAGISVDRRPVRLYDIAPDLVRAVISSEDQAFCTHMGFDWAAIEKARNFNARNQRTRGASTISMQTAKNAFLWPSRTWVRKGMEAYFTALIETFWPKRRIMEVYLNVAEWGKGIYGAEAAARRYFGKPASRLTDYEAALLAAALPTPTRSNPASPTAYLSSRAREIVRVMPKVEAGCVL